LTLLNHALQKKNKSFLDIKALKKSSDGFLLIKEIIIISLYFVIIPYILLLFKYYYLGLGPRRRDIWFSRWFLIFFTKLYLFLRNWCFALSIHLWAYKSFRLTDGEILFKISNKICASTYRIRKNSEAISENHNLFISSPGYDKNGNIVL